MATYTKRIPTGSTDGEPILIGTSPSTIAVAAASATAGAPIDEVWLWANALNGDRVLYLQVASQATIYETVQTVSYRGGLQDIIRGHPIKNAKIIVAYADATGVVCFPFVNRITP